MCIRMCVCVCARTSVLVNYSQSAESRATIFSYISRMTNRRQVLLNNRASLAREVTLLSLAKNSFRHCLRGARHFSLYLSLAISLLNKLLLRLLRGSLVMTVLFINMSRDTKVFVLPGFSSFRWHVFVVLSRATRKRKRIAIADRNNWCIRRWRGPRRFSSGTATGNPRRREPCFYPRRRTNINGGK